MFLIYINELGKDYKGQRQYEFIFGKSNENWPLSFVLKDDWFIIPSSGRATPPDIDYIDIVGLLKNSDLELELIQNSDYFGLIDAYDGVIALGWETFDKDLDIEERPSRVSFHFGEELKSVTDKLSSRGLLLIKEEIKYKFQ